MILHAMLVLTMLGPTTAADTLDMNGRVRLQIVQYYFGGSNSPLSSYQLGPEPAASGYCTADSGHQCFGGDWTQGACRSGALCHPSPLPLIDFMQEAAREYPESGYIAGQLIFGLLRLDRVPEAIRVVDACQSSEWWCSALGGMVAQAVGQTAVAEGLFREFVAAAPDSIRCSMEDPTELLGTWSQRREAGDPPQDWERDWSSQSCDARVAAADTVWWLADPLHIVEGNERWVEHLDRSLKARFLMELGDHREFGPGTPRQRAARRAAVTRRGPWDSYQTGFTQREREGGYWTGVEAAKYHFVPDFAEDRLSSPTWRLEADLEDEGFTPLYGPLYEIPIQSARFRTGAGDAMQLLVSGTTDGGPLTGSAGVAYLVMSDAPDSFPLELESPLRAGRAIFLAEAPPKRYVTSFEILTEGGVGRYRTIVPPIDLEGPAISDLLLFAPSTPELPQGLIEAAALMHSTTELESPSSVGLFWEVYPADPDTTLELEMELMLEGRRIDEIRTIGTFPGADASGGPVLAWTSLGAGLATPGSIVLDLEGLDAGSYTMVLRAQWEAGQLVEARRSFVLR